MQGPEEFSDMGDCEKEQWVVGKISWNQQRDCQSLIMEFSGGKLKQKGFFHSVLMLVVPNVILEETVQEVWI